MPIAIDIIKKEHRNYVAVLQCLEGVMRDVERGAASPDFVLFEAILDYIESFLDTFHHPKEDRFLFSALRKRHPQAEPLLAKLEAQHEEGYQRLKDLKAALQAYEAEGTAKAEAFFEAVRSYHAFEWNHMRSEEMEVIPLAREHVPAEDWAEIDEAFNDHEDPLFGDKPQAKFKALLSKIVRMAPAPHGYGDPKGPGPS
jgi:hemerythrin-like domain-containing protein